MGKTGLLHHVSSPLDAMGMVDTIYLDMYYTEYRDLLTKQQWNLLFALAHGEGIGNVTKSSFIKKNELSNAATIRRRIQSLTDKKMIYKKEREYFVYDVFFANWLKNL